MNKFAFYNTGKLQDHELELKLVKTAEAIPEKDYAPCYYFDMVNIETGEKMGEIRARIGEFKDREEAGNIGYNVDEKYRGNRYAARSCKLLFPLFRKHGMESVLITCDPDNIASRKTCESAGGKFLRIQKLDPNGEMYQDGEREKCVYEIKFT